MRLVDRHTQLSAAIKEWETKPRRMGCVAATKWLVSRVPAFEARRITRYTKNGEVFEHVVATDGTIVIDLAPYADSPRQCFRESGNGL